ncbi:hypothetical protein DSO57_1037561 [Entomophthora muscae]|uniref:Uncharacterized protein n=1 Tax=Entomophthora muscae TaxID=34485 RepID=A0ACC2RDQ7_9FUNG|nr:hypothetical protein DSO57_1037561 [Entomophthora muscae]
MAIFEPATGTSNPHNSFLMEGELPQGNLNAHPDISCGLSQLCQFMDEIPCPLLLGSRLLLLLTAPTPMEVDTNASPSEEVIQQTMTRMNN